MDLGGPSGNQSGSTTWMAVGLSWRARRMRERQICPLIWLAPIWNGAPTPVLLVATSSLSVSNSSSSRVWNSPAVPHV